MELRRDVILKNKETIIEIINNVSDPENRLNKEALINYLTEESDFFTAPASTKFHLACEGGLAQHSLNVYNNLKLLVKEKGFEDVYSDLNITIVSLLHDISKTNFYSLDYRNKKFYNASGSKMDNNGQFDWISVPYYTIREGNERFIFGNHEMNSELLARYFVSLTIEESVAILHHMGGKGHDSAQDEITLIFNNYPLASLLHCADLLATYIDERTYE